MALWSYATPASAQMFQAGEYRHCLQQIARVMQLTGDAAKEYDRYQLLLGIGLFRAIVHNAHGRGQAAVTRSRKPEHARERAPRHAIGP